MALAARSLVSLLLLGTSSALIIPRAGTGHALQARSVSQGWSLQAQSCPSGTNMCSSGGACCPSNMYCFSAANAEVASCCGTNSPCRGAVEGNPICADTSWDLWQGMYQNGFCCQGGMVGAYYGSGSTAGNCYTSVPAGATSATLKSRGVPTATSSTRPPSTTTTTTTSSQTSKTTTSPKSTPTGTGNGAGKAVFAHYMVGTTTQQHAANDIQEAINAGFDGFALNTHTISSGDTWNTNTLNYLFQAAAGTNFKLFISFDMSWGLDVGSLAGFLAPYARQSAYYKVSGKAFVSTFWGGKISNNDWSSKFIQPMISNYGITPYFVPNFDDAPGWTSNTFNTWPVVDGVFSWESAWPAPGTTISNVSSSVDSSLLQQARAANKAYMMPISSFQFKTFNGDNWYRIGEINLPQRMGQVLQLQPDFVELLTWNDAGESHYVGDWYPEQVPTEISNYASGFDHKGWLQVITPFIAAYKSGASSLSNVKAPGSAPVGTLWYRTLLTSASCASSLPIQNHQQAQDNLNYAVILPSSGYTIKMYSNNIEVGSVQGQAGLNYNSFAGLKTGSGQVLKVFDSSNRLVATATGTKDVQAQSSSSTCNWNYEVVGLSSN